MKNLTAIVKQQSFADSFVLNLDPDGGLAYPRCPIFNLMGSL
jgi:hypothetical protein